MGDKKKKEKRRQKPRRRLLTEDEFRKLIETGKATEKERRLWLERRKKGTG